MDIYSKERLEQVMNDMKTKVLPQIKSEIEKRAKKNIGIHNEATCSTTAGTAAKAVIAPSGFELSAGATIIVTFTNAISVTNATLTFGTAVDDTAEDYAEKNPATEGWYVLSSGDFTPTQDTEPQSGTTYYIVSAAKPIYYRGAALPANLVKAGMSLIMRYNGTQWDIISNIEALDDYLQVNAQNFSNAQKLQARTNIGAQENVTDMAKLGCGIGTCSTDSGTSLVVSLTDYELVKNGHVSVNFEHDVPAGATLNINGKGAKPIIYKGAAIEADTIKADDTALFSYDGTNYVLISSGGSAAPVNPIETVNISLTQVGGNSADLIGAAITIIDDGTEEILLSTTWSGNIITLEIALNIDYTVSVENISGYLPCAEQSYRAAYQNERNIVFQYAALGAYIESTDNQLYEASQWSSAGKTANSIVILTSSIHIRLSLDRQSLKVLNRHTGDVASSYITPIQDETAAKSDYSGNSNTNKLINYLISEGQNTPTYAPVYCAQYVFPDGVTRGYLGSAGEMWLVCLNKTSINMCLTALGLNTLVNCNTSTYYGATIHGVADIWYVNFYSDAIGINPYGAAAEFTFYPISRYSI